MTERVTKKERKLYYSLHNKMYGKTEKRREYMRKWMANKRKQLKYAKQNTTN